jgi:hypothetical protein
MMNPITSSDFSKNTLELHRVSLRIKPFFEMSTSCFDLCT